MRRRISAVTKSKITMENIIKSLFHFHLFFSHDYSWKSKHNSAGFVILITPHDHENLWNSQHAFGSNFRVFDGSSGDEIMKSEIFSAAILNNNQWMLK